MYDGEPVVERVPGTSVTDSPVQAVAGDDVAMVGRSVCSTVSS